MAAVRAIRAIRAERTRGGGCRGGGGAPSFASSGFTPFTFTRRASRANDYNEYSQALAAARTTLLNSRNNSRSRWTPRCLSNLSPDRDVSVSFSSSSSSSSSSSFYSSQPSSSEGGDEESSVASFEHLGLRGSVLEALEELGLETPSEIQALAIRSILQGEGKLDALEQNGVVLASHTGSGKTLAYLLPIVQKLKEWEEYQGRGAPKRPRAIVVAPTQELVEQIFKVAKSLGHVVKISSTMVSARSKFSVQKKSMEKPVDILVGTPNRILRLNREGFMWYGDVKYLVLDEADLLLGEDYVGEVLGLVKPMVTKKDKAKVVMVTASKTRMVERFLRDELNGGLEVETTSLHRAVSSAKHQFLNQGQDDKLELLEQTILPHIKGKHGLVFCNTLDSCRAVEHYLQNNDYNSFCLHGSVPLATRKDVLTNFMGSKSGGLLITTDLAARGLDFGGKVKFVVNFDFPHNKVDYLHRTGRTARAGSHGKVFSLVRGKDRRLAREIELAVQSKDTIEEKALRKQRVERSSKLIKGSRVAARKSEGPRGARDRKGQRKGYQRTTDTRSSGRGRGRQGGGRGR